MRKWNKKFIRTIYVTVIICFIGWIGFSMSSLEESKREVAAVSPTPELAVSHFVKGNKLFLEFRLKHFDLSKEKLGRKSVYGEGHIHLFIDGKKVADITRGAYVYTGLPAGTYRVKVELAHHDHQPYGVGEEFTITIPKNVPHKLSE